MAVLLGIIGVLGFILCLMTLIYALTFPATWVVLLVLAILLNIRRMACRGRESSWR